MQIVARRGRDAGLDALVEIAIDTVPDLAGVISTLTAKGFQQLRLTIDKAPAADRGALMLRAASLQDGEGASLPESKRRA